MSRVFHKFFTPTKIVEFFKSPFWSKIFLSYVLFITDSFSKNLVIKQNDRKSKKGITEAKKAKYEIIIENKY